MNPRDLPCIGHTKGPYGSGYSFWFLENQPKAFDKGECSHSCRSRRKWKRFEYKIIALHRLWRWINQNRDVERRALLKYASQYVGSILSPWRSAFIWIGSSIAAAFIALIFEGIKTSSQLGAALGNVLSLFVVIVLVLIGARQVAIAIMGYWRVRNWVSSTSKVNEAIQRYADRDIFHFTFGSGFRSQLAETLLKIFIVTGIAELIAAVLFFEFIVKL
jgi:hypothetical protein